MKQSNVSSSLKTKGLIILLVPATFISLFLIGETVGGDISGFGHLLQLIPLVICALLAIKFPYWTGILLVFLGFILAICYASFTGMPIPTIIIVDSILFLPLVVSGAFLISSATQK